MGEEIKNGKRTKTNKGINDKKKIGIQYEKWSNAHKSKISKLGSIEDKKLTSYAKGLNLIIIYYELKELY